MGNALDSEADVSYSFASDEPGRVLETLAFSIGPMPRVLLPDTQGNSVESRVVKPMSGEMPSKADRSSRVQLLGEIARGGMGAILKGRDPDLGRDLAVKVLLDAHRDKPELVRRFIEEAQIGGQLQHPGVVPVYELGTFGDSRPYFTMKLVKGRTLAEILAERPEPTDDRPRFVAMLLQVAQTVAYAHARGVIHRDLKPSNIMVGSFGEVQVMDWGLAKVLPRGGVEDDASAGLLPPEGDTIIATNHPEVDPDGDRSRAGSILGTPSYMAPEQARGETDRLDERCDVFALGSILAEVLTGQPAFTGRSGGEILRKAARGDFLEGFARLDGSGADAALVDLAKNCLAAEPEDRPADAQEVADRLLDHINSVHFRLREAELAQAAEYARAEEAKRTASAESARAEEAHRAAESAEAQTRAERRARRLQVGLAASLIGLMALGGGGFALIERQKAERASRTTQAVNDALADAARFQGEAMSAPSDELGKWGEAVEAVKRAEALLAQGEADALSQRRVADRLAQIDREQAKVREKTDRMKADRILLAELESIRGDRAVHNELHRTNGEYAAAFRKAGLDFDKVGPVEAARWLASRSRPAELAGYLDDWASVSRRAIRTGVDDWRRLVATARAADPDPWRDALRARLGAGDDASLAELRRLADDGKALDAQSAAGLALLARELLDLGEPADRERAADVLHRAATRHPGDFWVHYELASLRPEWAISHLTAAVAIRPGSASAHHGLGNALKGGPDRSDDAVTEYREALRLKPDNSWVQVALDTTLKEQGKLDEEVASCREAVRLHPDDPWAHANLAGTLKASRKLDEAIAEFREAIRLKPDMLLAYVELGGACWDAGKYHDAVLPWREAVRLNPDDSTMHRNLSMVLRGEGKLDEAVAELREAIRLKPDSASAHKSLSEILREMGKPDESAAELRETNRLDPNSIEFYIQRSKALREQGKLVEALGQLREAARTKSNSPVDRYYLGHAFRELNEPEEALNQFRQAVRLDGDKPGEAIFSLGSLLRSLGRYDEAVATYREAIRIQPDKAWAHVCLSNALKDQGKFDEAVAEHHEAIRLEPGDAGSYCNFGTLLRIKGDYAGSLEMFRKGHELGTKQSGWNYPSAEWVAKAEELATQASRLSAILKGEDRPRDNADRLTLAQMCYDSKRYAAGRGSGPRPLKLTRSSATIIRTITDTTPPAPPSWPLPERARTTLLPTTPPRPGSGRRRSTVSSPSAMPGRNSWLTAALRREPRLPGCSSTGRATPTSPASATPRASRSCQNPNARSGKRFGPRLTPCSPRRRSGKQNLDIRTPSTGERER